MEIFVVGNNLVVKRGGPAPRWGEGERRGVGAGWAFGACPELAEGLLSFSGGEKESKSADEGVTLTHVMVRDDFRCGFSLLTMTLSSCYNHSMKKVLLVIALKGYQDVELNGTRKELESLGFEIVIASTEAGECIGKFGGRETASIALRNVNVDDYDRIAFIGGPGAHYLIDDIYAKATAMLAVEHGIPLGAICIAPLILANAGLLEGKNATCWDKDGKQFVFLEKNGAIVDHFDPVVVDGTIVTANGPEAAEEFGRVFGQLTV